MQNLYKPKVPSPTQWLGLSSPGCTQSLARVISLYVCLPQGLKVTGAKDKFPLFLTLTRLSLTLCKHFETMPWLLKATSILYPVTGRWTVWSLHTDKNVNILLMATMQDKCSSNIIIHKQPNNIIWPPRTLGIWSLTVLLTQQLITTLWKYTWCANVWGKCTWGLATHLARCWPFMPVPRWEPRRWVIPVLFGEQFQYSGFFFLTQASLKYPYSTLTMHAYSTHLSSFVKSAYVTKPFSGAEPSWHNDSWSMRSKNLKWYKKQTNSNYQRSKTANKYYFGH